MTEVSTKLLSFLRVYVVGSFGALMLTLLKLSIRWQDIGPVHPLQMSELNSAKIIAFWHNRQLMAAFLYRRKGCALGKGLYALISQHGDGRMIAWAVRLLGIRSVAGSSTRGGREAALALLDKLQHGFDAAITPDGPRGPKHEAKKGVVVLAKESAAPIYPLALAFDRYWSFGSWDKMILPKPFARAVFSFGEPIKVPKDLDADGIETYRRRVEQELNVVSSRVDSYFHAEEKVYV